MQTIRALVSEDSSLQGPPAAGQLGYAERTGGFVAIHLDLMPPDSHRLVACYRVPGAAQYLS